MKLAFDDGLDRVQSVEYESSIRFCGKCGSMSHFMFACDDRKALGKVSVMDKVVDDHGWQQVKMPRHRQKPWRGGMEGVMRMEWMPCRMWTQFPCSGKVEASLMVK